MIRIFQATVGLVLVTVIVASLNWSSIYGLRIRLDLHHIAKQVRKADVELGEKERLLDQVDAIRDRIRHGHQPSIISWWEATDAIEELADWGIRDDEPRLIERELDRIRREIDETDPDG